MRGVALLGEPSQAADHFTRVAVPGGTLKKNLEAKTDALALPDPALDPEWAPEFKQAVYFLAGFYGAQAVKNRSMNERNRGSTMSAKEVAEVWRDNAEWMTRQILRTTRTDGWVKCDCSRGYRYTGPGRTADDWERCMRCEGTGELSPSGKPAPRPDRPGGLPWFEAWGRL